MASVFPAGLQDQILRIRASDLSKELAQAFQVFLSTRKYAPFEGKPRFTTSRFALVIDRERRIRTEVQNLDRSSNPTQVHRFQWRCQDRHSWNDHNAPREDQSSVDRPTLCRQALSFFLFSGVSGSGGASNSLFSLRTTSGVTTYRPFSFSVFSGSSYIMSSMMSSTIDLNPRAPVSFSFAFLAISTRLSGVNSTSAPLHLKELTILLDQSVPWLGHNLDQHVDIQGHQWANDR